MSNYATLKSAIASVIKTNGSNGITAAKLLAELNRMIDSLGAGYQFRGVASTSINPGTPDQKVFYLATPGNYTNFGGLTVPDGNIGVFLYSNNWVMQSISIGQLAGVGTSDLNVTTIEDSGDFAIADANGNVLVEFKDGHIKTQRFNSRNVNSGTSSGALNVATIEDSGDFVIADANGNVLVEFKDGHIKTKRFNSRNVNSSTSGSGVSYAERPSTGYENFAVSVNYKNTYTPIGTVVSEQEDDASRIYDDDCVIALPTNYSQSGKPVRLIIHCGGTGERINSTTNPTSYYGWSYFLKKGYAVMDCNGVSDAYISAVRGGGTRNHFGGKFLLQSYKKAYDYVIRKYNIASDGCFVTGISMGGLASFMIVQSGMFPVLAQAGFCPCIDLFKQNFLKPWDDNVAQTAIDYGFDAKIGSETNQQWFIRNMDKTIGWNSMIKNTFGDKSNLWTYFEGSNEENVYNGLSKFYPCPLKIWHSTDDGVVTYRYSKYMVAMIRNAGGTAELHTYSSGGHFAGWDFGSVTDSAVGMTTSISFYEAIKFFERYS